jgi:hypothetical protein
VVIGLTLAVLVHRTDWLYPALAQFDVAPRRYDAQMVKMRGNAEVGSVASQLRASMPDPAKTFVLTRMYQDAAILSFYMDGRPKAFHIGSYLHGLNKAGEPLRTRFSQWDLWPDRDLSPERSLVIGQDAIFMGDLDEAGTIAGAFERVDRSPTMVRIERHGVFVREFKLYRCYGFKGVRREATGGTN